MSTKSAGHRAAIRWQCCLGLTVISVLVGCQRIAFENPGDVRRDRANRGETLTVRTTAERAARRAYAGAPPVIPHPPQGQACIRCHDQVARAVPPLGLAPANPHRGTSIEARTRNCRQCHVFQRDTSVFVETQFVGLKQTGQPGDRLYPGAPPVAPHSAQLHENCLACHAGPAARPEIRCSHPERVRCRQCHMFVSPHLQAEAPMFTRSTRP